MKIGTDGARMLQVVPGISVSQSGTRLWLQSHAGSRATPRAAELEVMR